MPVEVIMPKVDMDMASGKVATWHVLPGEYVEKGTPLFDIETDKAAMEVEAEASGFLHHPAAEGVDIPIGQPVAWLYQEGEELGEPPVRTALADADDKPSPQPVSETGSEPVCADETDEILPQQFGASDKVRATPLARSIAQDAALELTEIAGTGPRGRIQAIDVRGQVEARLRHTSAVQFQPESGPLNISRSRDGAGMPVVLIHGFGSDASSWKPLEAYLQGRPVIRIELPGHGKSPKLRIDSFTELSSAIRRAFDMLDIERAHLVGHSLGGALALSLADTRSKSIASLTLIAPGGLGPEVNGPALEGISKSTRAESLGPWLKVLVSDEKLITDGYVKAAMAPRKDPALRAAQARLCDTLFPDGVQPFDLKAALDRIDVPARIIWGKQDAIIPWRHALRAPGNIALHLFDGVGHMPQFEVPSEVGKILRQVYDGAS
nr:acetoin dehydrogenase dihydrolipoyllysine-residue acetyltransferase subunit [Marinicella sp. W31]MDC2878597.1 acetoin dehydrogenase dihydrolipoyllysine-residue acetyltransferase subunit [Marinicella sp. W31]